MPDWQIFLDSETQIAPSPRREEEKEGKVAFVKRRGVIPP